MKGAAIPVIAAGSFLVLLAGCTSHHFSRGTAVQYSTAPSPYQENLFPNWPYPPHTLEEKAYPALLTGQYEIREMHRTEHGLSGAQKITVYFPQINREVLFKWSAVTRENVVKSRNSPRKEMAAYEVQKLFLDPQDYVVPPSFLVWLPSIQSGRKSQLPDVGLSGGGGSLGIMAPWLVNVEIPEVMYDEKRFLADPVYAYFLSNFNLLTNLIRHRDMKPDNVLVSKNDRLRHVFSIDNDISFTIFPHIVYRTHWDKIRVPALRKESIARLRALRREDLDNLGVLAQLKNQSDGSLQPVPRGANLDPPKAVRTEDDTVQFGLTEDEIERLWKRIQSLLSMVDAEEVSLF